MTAADLSAYRWLTSPDTEPWLAEATTSQEPLPTQTRRLRRSLSALQTHLVLEQVELRRRAAEKFSQAGRMFFTRRALEQATSEVVARWKAERFTAAGGCDDVRTPWADLCCGIGGDLLSLAARRATIGVERDEVVALLAEANLAALGAASSEVRRQDVREFLVKDCLAWHLDSDRRTMQGRVAQPEFAEPGLDAIERLLAGNPHGAIKLAPAANVPDSWAAQSEREWISEEGECKQQTAWFGRLARRPGQRSATLLRRQAPPRMMVGSPDVRLAIAGRVRRFVYEPDAAVIAAGLVGAIAEEHRCEAIAPNIAYLTADQPLHDPALAGFEVLETLPLDRKRLKATLRERGVGRLEIKKRGVEVNLDQLRRELQTPGENAATLLLAPLAGRATAILARRLA
jgi:hypothetical protein